MLPNKSQQSWQPDQDLNRKHKVWEISSTKTSMQKFPTNKQQSKPTYTFLEKKSLLIDFANFAEHTLHLYWKNDFVRNFFFSFFFIKSKKTKKFQNLWHTSDRLMQPDFLISVLLSNDLPVFVSNQLHLEVSKVSCLELNKENIVSKIKNGAALVC